MYQFNKVYTILHSNISTKFRYIQILHGKHFYTIEIHDFLSMHFSGFMFMYRCLYEYVF